MASPATKIGLGGEAFTKYTRKRNNSSDEGSPRYAKKHIWSKNGDGAVATNSPVIPTRNNLALSRMDENVTVFAGENGVQQLATFVPKAAGRPPPVIITVSLNLLKFQGELKTMIKGTFELRTTRNRMQVVTKDMADYLALMRYLDASKIPYYTFHPKSVKSVKAVIHHLPGAHPQRLFQMNYWQWASISLV
jgi:hypothetical protein